MTSSNFMIGPVKDGMRRDLRPFAIPEDAFEVLTNAYQYRGRIVRRSGYNILGQLQLTVTVSASLVGGSFTLSNTPIIPGTISITGGTDGSVYTDPGKNGTLIATGGTGSGGTINYLTGVMTITGGGTETITGTYGYAPMLPVMGLATREEFAIDNQQLVAFDTVNSYYFTGGSSGHFDKLPTVMQVAWSGTNSQFFWTTNYANAFWATNSKPGINGFAISAITTGGTTTITTASANGFTSGQTVAFVNIGGTVELNGITAVITVTGPSTFTIPVATSNAYTSGGMVVNSFVTVPGQDGIRYYGALSNGTGWANYNPPLDTLTVLAGALLIFAYRGYLVFLNTYEGNETGVPNYPNRARWTQNGTPYYSPPQPISPNEVGIDPLAARSDIFGRGSYNDAPTNEAIVGANFIRDILVVYFERSTWRLRFVNNSENPFVWERVNIEFGSECTFSCIPFDKGLMAIGNRGILISDGNDTSRFDEKIPNEVFKIRQNNNGFQRVCGIRTFQTRLCYWTFPSDSSPLGIYPDQVLVFNYETRNWSFFDDTFTIFGYYYPTGAAQTWADMDQPWSSYGNITWDSGVQSEDFETIVAGNQQGYVLQLEQTQGDNGPSLSIMSISGAVITSPDHNLPSGAWIQLSGITGSIATTDGVSLNGRNFKISNPSNNANTFTLTEFKPITGLTAIGSSFNTQIDYVPIIPCSVQINIGSDVYDDMNGDGNIYLVGSSPPTPRGTIDYYSGLLTINFSSPISSTPVIIRVVSYSPSQTIDPIDTSGTYTGGGQISKISNFDIQTKIFNFFQDDKRSRLSKIDFYVDQIQNGQFTCNVFADSSDSIVNFPLADNLQSNVVITSPNPYQFGSGDETIFRLYCDAIAQTIQLQLTLSDQQQAVTAVNSANYQWLALMVTLRRGGRLI